MIKLFDTILSLISQLVKILAQKALFWVPNVKIMAQKSMLKSIFTFYLSKKSTRNILKIN